MGEDTVRLWIGTLLRCSGWAKKKRRREEERVCAVAAQRRSGGGGGEECTHALQRVKRRYRSKGRVSQ